MKQSLEDDQPRPGLRERKKAKTRASIQEHALRLFQEQGYEATTVEQICDAAEVSPSTFFRYFPTKEDVVLYDVVDPLLLEAFRAQPADLTPMQALRAAFRSVFQDLPAGELARQRERGLLIFSVPQLRSAVLDQLTDAGQLLAGLVAERLGRAPNDFAVRVFAGAVTGVIIAAALPAVDDPAMDIFTVMDAGLAHLEAGLPF